MNNFLEGLLFARDAREIADVFLWLIVVVFFFAIYEAAQKKHSRFLEHAPSIMTSLGILGTFTGIVIGLLHFDSRNIDASIPMLLAGLQTAFITSLMGMLAAIVFKSLDSFFFAPRRDTESQQPQKVSPEHIHAEIVKTNINLSELKEALAGSEEGSLAGLIRLARSEINDHHRERVKESQQFSERLFKEMHEFAELLSKSATEQVIEALKQVIVDFNKNLTEQFGENFKRLDESVKKLVDWQQQYMEQLDQMSSQYAEGVKAISSTRDAVTEISLQTGQIPASMEHLKEVMQVNQHQIQELQRHLEAFISMRDKAVDAIPTINKQLDEVGKTMAESADAMRRVILEGATEFGQSVERTNTSMQNMANGIQSQSESINQTLQDVANEVSSTSRDMLGKLQDGAITLQSNLESSIDSAMVEIRKVIEKSGAAMEDEVIRSVSRTGESINKQLDALDNALSDEMTRVMQEMGAALTTISGQFSSDYERLVTAMDQVVRQQPRI